MSGPKVVRIVTREEVEAICRGLIASFEHAAAELKHCAERHDLWTKELEAAITDKRRALGKMFERERWIDIQKHAPLEAEFLRDETQRMKSAVISKAEAARGARRRIVDAAGSLAAALESAGRAVPTELRGLAARASSASDAELASMQAVLNAAFSELKDAASPARATGEQQELANRLGKGETHTTYADWLVANTPTSESDARLDRLLAEIEVLEHAEAARGFAARAAAIAAEPSVNRRALLTDSLVLELSACLATARRRESVVAAMREVRGGLDRVSADAADLGRRLDRAIGEIDIQAGEKLVEEARQLAATEARRAASVARRRAVLKGLAALGYEVRENMASAWAQAGRIVVKKPGVTDYGVELGATTCADQMQVRLVGAAEPLEPRTAQRDRDTEAQWCEDFGRLRQTLAKTGTELKLERGVGVGMQPVKTVIMADIDCDTGSNVARPRGQRKL